MSIPLAEGGRFSSVVRGLWYLLHCLDEFLLNAVGFTTQVEVELGCDKWSLETTEEGRMQNTSNFSAFLKGTKCLLKTARVLFGFFSPIPELEMMLPAISEAVLWLKNYLLLLVYLDC